MSEIVEYKGESHSLYEWGKITGIGYQTLKARFVNGDRDECAKENARRNANLCAERKKLQPKKEKKLTVTQIAVMAKKAGMSYGQYSAMLALRKEREANGKV